MTQLPDPPNPEASAAQGVLPRPPRPRRSGPLQRFWRRQRRFHSRPMETWAGPWTIISNLMLWWQRPMNWLQILGLLLLVGVFIAQASIFWTAVIDDSYITFRFVDMFVKGHGWRFSPEGPRVEGFTNFLWAVLLLIPHALGWDLMFVAKQLGMACGIGAMAASWRLAATIRQREDLFNLLPAALLATNTHFAHWAQMGLETLLQVFLVTAAYYRFEYERRFPRAWLLSPLICVLAAMTRIDSLYYLSPLGLYGWALVLQRRLPIKRLLLWGVLAAIPFLAYQTWRINYFGDWYPNTYYAKQRMVIWEGRDRGLVQLWHFYLDQAAYPKTLAPPPPRDAEGLYAFWQRADRLLFKLGMAQWNSFAWMNFWAFSGCLALLAMFTYWLVPRRYWLGRRAAWLRDAHFFRIGCLLLAPWFMNIYYVYHVNGDWMPSFRFSMIVLPFIGASAAVGFGWLREIAGTLSGSLIMARAAAAGAFTLAALLLLGTATEQLRTNSVFIFGREATYWGPREKGWSLPEKIYANYSRGFSPPLNDVANWLLLNTVDDAWIYMHDIGQPLWYSEHLNLYDADGLTDPHLAHAPSRRGDVPTAEQHFEKLLEQRPEDAGPMTEELRSKIWLEAQKQEFNDFVERNRDWLMQEKKPEYLIIFLSHTTHDPDSPGFPYPQISAAVFESRERKQYYVRAETIPKIGTVYNHFFRRREIPATVSDEIKLRRIFRAIERNPRMPLLLVLLFRESNKMDLTQDQRKKIDQIMLDAMERWWADPVMSDLAREIRRSGRGELAAEALRLALKRNPENLQTYRALSQIYQEDRQYDKALAVLEDALEKVPYTEAALYYDLVWLAGAGGDFQKAIEFSEEASGRYPMDWRVWSDRGAMLDRYAWEPDLNTEERQKARQQALAAFREMDRLMNPAPPEVRTKIKELAALLGEDQSTTVLDEAKPTPSPAPPQPAMDSLQGPNPRAQLRANINEAIPPATEELPAESQPAPTPYLFRRFPSDPQPPRAETMYDPPLPLGTETRYNRAETRY